MSAERTEILKRMAEREAPLLRDLADRSRLLLR